MKITSTAFQDGKTIPTKYTHQGVRDGKNISLPFAWTESPAETKSFALSIIDPHPVAKNWVHWFVTDLPNSVRELMEGSSKTSMPYGSKELLNTYGEIGYGGPEPPKGSGPHPYVVTVYALNTASLGLSKKTTLPEFIKALEGKLLSSATMTGIFER